jgi:hypothetical protein
MRSIANAAPYRDRWSRGPRSRLADALTIPCVRLVERPAVEQLSSNALTTTLKPRRGPREIARAPSRGRKNGQECTDLSDPRPAGNRPCASESRSVVRALSEGMDFDAVSRNETEPSGRAEPSLTPQPRHTLSAKMQRVYDEGVRAVSSGASILILGEEGVGKYVLAAWLHAPSPHAHPPLLAVNIAGRAVGRGRGERRSALAPQQAGRAKRPDVGVAGSPDSVGSR